MKSHWDCSCISKLFWLSQCPACVLIMCKLSLPLKIVNYVCINMLLVSTTHVSPCISDNISSVKSAQPPPPHLRNSEPKINSALMDFPSNVFHRTRSTVIHVSLRHCTCSLVSYNVFSTHHNSKFNSNLF